jgi:phage gp46-like protein
MIKLAWDPTRQGAVIARTETGALATDDTLQTSVILSLFLDRLAEPDDALPDPSANGSGALFARRGWVGDAIAMRASEATADRTGSRLWLLSRAKQTAETLRLAEDYAAEALEWLLADGLATAVATSAEWAARGLMEMSIQITLPSGETNAFTFGLRTA